MTYAEVKLSTHILRKFSHDVVEDDLVWHIDEFDRNVLVVEGCNWYLQVDNQLPIQLYPNNTYFIPAKVYHRIIKGTTDLIILINEINKLSDVDIYD